MTTTHPTTMRPRRLLALAALAATTAAPLAAQQYPTEPPPPAPVKPASFPPFKEATLANGMRIVLVENHRQPVLSLSLSFDAGSSHDPAGKEGTADLVATLLTKGAGSRTADQVSAAIEGVGGFLAASAGRDFLTVRTNVLSQHAALAFELLADAVTRPTFAEKEVELARTQALSNLQYQLSQPGAIAQRAFMNALYGRHPYGRDATPATVRGIARADLVAYQKSRLAPRGALLVIAGDMTLAQARQLAQRHFGSWTGAAPAAAARPAPARRAKPEIILVHRPGSVQSNIVVGNTTVKPADPQYFPLLVANKILGGGTDSRLFMILREQKGWTYGAYSNVARARDMGEFVATAEVRNEVTDSALVELLAQVRSLGEGKATAAELEAAKGALVGSFPLTVQTAEQVAAQVTTAKLLGLPADYLNTYRTKLAAVTPAQLRAAAKAHMRADAPLVVVVGDGSKVHAKLAKLGDVRIVTPQGDPMRPEDLVARAATSTIDPARLVARRDSFAVIVQGRPFGYQVSAVEKTANGFTVTERTVLGPVVDQTTTVQLDATGAPVSVRQGGKTMGRDTKIELDYAGGRVKGTAVVPDTRNQGQMKTVNVDTTVAAGTTDENLLQTIIPTLRWAPGAKHSVTAFGASDAAPKTFTMTVAGEEQLTVPAGTFAAWKLDVTGGQLPTTFHITKDAPHRVLKIAPVGQPIEIVLVK